MRYKARKRLALLILVLGLPLYVVVAWAVMGSLDRPPIWVELLVYAGLGVVWIVPLRRVFLGLGRADPDEAEGPDGPPSDRG